MFALRSLPHRSLLLLAFAAFDPGALVAQDLLRLDGWQKATLPSGDPRRDDVEYYDVWRLPSGLAGVVSITVEAKETEMDPYIRWGYPTEWGFEILADNDDFPGLSDQTSARIHIRPSDDPGAVLQVFDSWGEGGGEYRILAVRVTSPVPAAETIDFGADLERQLAEGDSLVDGAFVDRFRFRGSKGDVVRVAMEADFDPTLSIVAEGSTYPLSDPDAGIGDDGESDIEVAIPSDGVYQILATSQGFQVGPYRLKLRRSAPSGASGPATGLRVTPGSVTHELLGFSFVAPAGDLVLVSEQPLRGESGPPTYLWQLRSAQTGTIFQIFAQRPGSDVTATLLENTLEAIRANVGATVDSEHSEALGPSRVAFLTLPGGSGWGIRCSGSPTLEGAWDLLVCLTVEREDGMIGLEGLEALDGLRVR